FPDVSQIGSKTFLGDRKVFEAERGNATDSLEDVALHENVIGNRDHVELSRLTIEVDHFADGETAVAPGRVYVKITKEEWFVSRQVKPSHQCDCDPRADDAGFRTRSS